MTTFTSRNVPLAQSTDAADIAARLNPVAQLQHDRPGVSPLTTTQVNALTGAELWDGRLVLDTTTDRIKRYDLGTTTWITIPDSADIAALLATTGTPADLGLTASRGVGSSAARADHVHAAPPWQAYTPTWTASVVNPVLGNGTMIARYTQIGKTVLGRMFLTIGSTTTIGSGVYQFTVPVTAAANEYGVARGLVLDTGVRHYFAAGVLATSNVMSLLWSDGATNVQQNSPITFATGDQIYLSLQYEAL